MPAVEKVDIKIAVGISTVSELAYEYSYEELDEVLYYLQHDAIVDVGRQFDEGKITREQAKLLLQDLCEQAVKALDAVYRKYVIDGIY